MYVYVWFWPTLYIYICMYMYGSGQPWMCTIYMYVYVWFWPTLDVHYIYVCICMVLANPSYIYMVYEQWFSRELPCGHTRRFGQNRTSAPYMTVYLVISLLKIPYIHRIYLWFWLTLHVRRVGQNRTSAPYMTVCMVISLLRIPYVHHIYL